MSVPGMYGDIKLIAGTGNPEVVQGISDYLSRMCMQPVPVLECTIDKFSNENIYVKLGESVRGQDVYVVQGMGSPVNDNIMELLIILDAVRRDSAGRITVVLPYFPYGRTDKKDQPRTPITARLIADLIQVAGADRYITVDLHAGQIQGFFNIPGDVLRSFYLQKTYVKENVPLDNLVVATTDLGFAKGGRDWARALHRPLAFIEKLRAQASVDGIETITEPLTMIGSVEGCDVLLVDDEVDTGGSICNAIELLDKKGAQEITLVFTHAVLSGPAWERLEQIQDRVREIIFTDTIPIRGKKLLPKMKVISIADMLGEVIRRAHEGASVGAMFDE